MINASGIGTYIKNLVPLVIEDFKQIKFFIMGKKTDLSPLGLLEKPNVEHIEFNAPIYTIKEQVLFPRLIPKETSLFWAPHYNFPVLFRGNLLVSIMDIGHLALRQINHEPSKRLYANFMFNQIKKRAIATIYISKFSKNEFNKYVGIPKFKQVITLLGINKDWFNISIEDQLYEKPYILSVGNLKPHKNLGALIKAFGRLRTKIPHNLVIVGKKEGFITGDNTLVEIANKFMDRIIFTGEVSHRDLKQYFKQADIFAFPSIYEGFGFPPLESMVAGTPVVASNAASIPEVCGDAVLYFDPFNIHDIAEKILNLITDVSLKDKLIKRSKNHVKKYTWDKTAFQTSNIIKNLLERN